MDAKERSKRKREWILAGFLCFLFIALTMGEFRLSKLSSTLPFVNSIFFFGLLNINLVILLGLAWLVFRNIGKLLIERRRKVLGARLKSKLVVSFVGFSIIPTLVLFTISATYINSSFDKWFSIKILNTLQTSLDVTKTYYRTADQIALHFAEHIAKGLTKRLRVEPHDGTFKENSSWIAEFLIGQRELLALNAVEFYADAFDERILVQATEGTDSGAGYPRLSYDQLERAFAGEKFTYLQHLGGGDLIRVLVPIVIETNSRGLFYQAANAVVVVNTFIPVTLSNKIDEIASAVDDYRDINPLKYPMKTTYLVILIMITLVIIFVAIWVGLFLAKELTGPVERLVMGARAVGAGNLDVHVAASGSDEISVLVDSFNRMTQDLKENQSKLTETTIDLEKRKLQLEAVLTNVGAGVLVVSDQGIILTFNRALSELLDQVAEASLNRHYEEAFRTSMPALFDFVEKAMESFRLAESPKGENGYFTIQTKKEPRTLAAMATPLRDQERGSLWGMVAVFDDMTQLLKGQREMAWREVARRIAHEIKNPLTPIKLSAQRLQRRFNGLLGKEGELLKECTDTIIRHTDELKEMVNEFSNFARWPEIAPSTNDLNQALQEVITLYQQAHSGVKFTTDWDPTLGKFDFDRDQVKRVLINLLENAVSALKSSKKMIQPELKVETHFNQELKLVVWSVEDNGPGMKDEVRDRVFEPYFSTKSEGTGLGLAIVKRIINDHNGVIRVQSEVGKGTKFLIELPVFTGSRGV